MVEEYQRSDIWIRALAERKNDKFQSERAMLRHSFISFRQRAAHLVAQISIDIPSLTVHDITHLDSLWETASLIAGPSYPVNPAEAYVLGGAILLHDAGMSVAAYPNKKAAIRSTTQWTDAVVNAYRARQNKAPSTAELADPDSEIAAQATSQVLRSLHATQAEQLATVSWPSASGSSVEYLIEDSDLRRYYGEIIGRIAASHWWNISDLPKLASSVTAGPGLPGEWTLDPVKIACILRLADACHIDHRRAPSILRTFVRPSGISADHWAFQERIGKPTRRDDALVIASGGSFGPDQVDAWWLAYDTAKMIDKELHQVSSLLADMNRPKIACFRVSGAEAPDRFSDYVRTNGWKPIDASVRISNVESVAELLGGTKLYGKNPRIALREIIQNAADAIGARRCLLGLGKDFGSISVALRKDEDAYWLDVTDNGIGMSENVLTGELVDFGKSLWRSQNISHEIPGLIGKGFQPIGRYGIGFFAAFMLGKTITVTSLRYGRAHSDCMTLEFRNGLGLRPILRSPSREEMLSEAGTKVSVRLEVDPKTEGGLLFETMFFSGSGPRPLSVVVSKECPTLDFNVDVDEFGKKGRVIRAGDWASLDSAQISQRLNVPFLSRNEFSQSFANVVEPTDGEVVGRLAVNPRIHTLLSPSVVTIGGFASHGSSHLAGFLIGGDPTTVVRDKAWPKMSYVALSSWATKQGNALLDSEWDDEDRSIASSIILCAGGDIGNLPFGRIDGEPLTREFLRMLAHDREELTVVHEEDLAHNEEDDVTYNQFDDNFDVSEQLVILANDLSALMTFDDIRWPQCCSDYTEISSPKTVSKLFEELLRQAWGEVSKDSGFVKVGEVDGTDIEREGYIYSRIR